MITKGQALLALRPGAEWNIINGEITWLDSEQTQPTEDEIRDKIVELEYTQEVEVYKVQRAAEYPDWGEQLDYIYHNGIDSWKTNVVDPVKAKYAKAEVDADELAARKATALAEYQLEEYTKD